MCYINKGDLTIQAVRGLLLIPLMLDFTSLGIRWLMRSHLVKSQTEFISVECVLFLCHLFVFFSINPD